MTTSTEVSSKSRLHTVAVVLASLIIPVPLITGRIVEAIMDSTNPAGLSDVTVPLAYLGQILIASFVMLGVVIVAWIVAMVMLYRREHSAKAISLPLTVGIIQIALGVLTIVLEQVVSSAAG